VNPHTHVVPNQRVWLRVADPDWEDALDARWAGRVGGRWNPPGSHPTLYLNADLETARLQILRLLEGTPVDIEDLADDAYVLVAATLPRDQECAVALTAVELAAIGLPGDYPADGKSGLVPRSTCQPIGAEVKRLELRGLLVRSAVTPDGRGTELAWFPATTRSRAHPVWEQPRGLSDWLDAESWEGVGLEPQAPVR